MQAFTHIVVFYIISRKLFNRCPMLKVKGLSHGYKKESVSIVVCFPFGQRIPPRIKFRSTAVNFVPNPDLDHIVKKFLCCIGEGLSNPEEGSPPWRVCTTLQLENLNVDGRPDGLVDNLITSDGMSRAFESRCGHSICFFLSHIVPHSGEGFFRLFCGYTNSDFTIDEGKGPLNPCRERNRVNTTGGTWGTARKWKSMLLH